MTWLTWRQHRIEAIIVGAALTVLAVLLIVTGRDIATTYQQLGVGACIANPGLNTSCPDIVDAFRQQFEPLVAAVPWLNFVPVLVGILVGAPLVARELEHGTHRLAWTQSVTRRRWLAVKLALVLGGALLASALLTALLTWWRGPFNQLDGNFTPNTFDFEGTAPLAYMAFALALAIAAGTLLRRAIPAMVVTLAGFLAARLPIEFFARPHYQPPLTATFDILQGNSPAGRADWVFDAGVADSTGRHVDFRQIFDLCNPGGPGAGGADKQSIFQCAHDHGFLSYVTYQPADRLWLFQGIETAIFALAALGLLALAVWWVRRHIS